MNEDNFQKRLGRGMTVLGWIVVLGILSVYFSRFLDQQNNPNEVLSSTQTHDYTQVQLQRNRYGHYVASGMINNMKVVFILDTGATDISVPEKIAKKLRLKPGIKVPVHTANGQVDVYASTLNSVSLGKIELNNISANINPYMQGEEVLLGMSFLKHLDFSQQGDQLLIRQY
ncbi:MAG: aspartyl protease [marine bacterium B5-7]|nr:MAG: aspartyl protease [marine bacterium B5-7]